MTDNKFKYWAFLCYSPQDNRAPLPGEPAASRLCWGDWLHAELEKFSIPAEFSGQINARGEIIPERIQPIFQNEPAPPDDASLSAAQRAELEQSNCLIVVCSPRSAKSISVNEAVQFFKQLGRSHRILPIVIDGKPGVSDGASTADDECFVPALRHPVKPDGTLDTARRERGFIFADARQHSGTELEIAKIKLIAGLIGVGFGGLWGREQIRRFAEAQQQVQAAHVQVSAARSEATEAQRQLQAAQQQVRAAQDKVLEIQNLPSDVHGQIQAAQNQAREAQNQLQEFQRQARETQSQLEESRSQMVVAENKVTEAQQQVREARRQAEETQRLLQSATSQVQAAPGEIQEAQRQADEARSQLQQVLGQVEVARTQTESAQNEARAARQLAEESERQLSAARSQNQKSPDQTLEVQRQAEAAQTKVQAAQNQIQQARRMNQVLALVALIAFLLASVAWWQRKAVTPAKSALAETQEPDLAADKMNQEQIQSALQKFGGVLPAANQRLDELAARIPAAEIPKTLHSSATILTEPQRSYFQLSLLERSLQTDLSGTLDWVQFLLDTDIRQRALEKIIPTLAADNPTNTLVWLNQFNPAASESSYAQLFQHWATNHPVQAIEQRTQLLNHDADEKILGVILSTWVDTQPDTAVNWASALPEGDWRSAVTTNLFSRWAAKNLAAATNACQQLPDSQTKTKVWDQIIAHWSRQDAPAAMQFASEHPELSSDAFGEIARALGGTDLPAATNWIANLPEGPKKNSALSALSAKWAQNDSSGLAVYALGLPAGEVQTRLLTDACRPLAMRDLPGTVDLLKPLADEQLRRTILKQAGRNCDLSQVNQTSKFISTLPAGADQQALVGGLLASWAAADPEAAVNWLNTFPETNAPTGQLQSVVKTWAQTEPAAAAQWLTNSVNEETISAFLEGATAKYPQYAGQWAQTVADETKRQKYLAQVARQWLQTDPAAAVKWIDSLELPDAIKQSLKTQTP